MLNNVTLVGRLTKDPEMRFTDSGSARTTFTLAVQRDYKNDRGEYDADFIPVICWRGTAELCAQYLSKGSLIGLTGRIEVRTYENKEGQTVWMTQVNASNVRFLDSRKKEESAGMPVQEKPFELSDDDLPF